MLFRSARVINLKRIISERRWDDTFKMSRLTSDLHNMNLDNKQNFRYSEDIKLYAQCLLNYLGKSKYQMILGIPESKHTKSHSKKKGEYDPRRINDILPSPSLLEQQRQGMITEHGVFHSYIELCSDLVQNISSFENLTIRFTSKSYS